MTREEAIMILQNIKPTPHRADSKSTTHILQTIALEMAIKALEQEPKYCDRNICIKNEYNGIGCDECEVTKSQEPKIGHWTHDGSHWKNRFICSECNNKLYDEPTNYCPNCGCAMVEPQESEDKE